MATRSMPTGAVPPGLDGEHQLGADAVGGGDQDRVAEAGRLEVEQRAEAAEAAHRAGPVGGAGERLDALDQRVAGLDVDAGVAIGQAVGAGVLGCGHAVLDRVRGCSVQWRG